MKTLGGRAVFNHSSTRAKGLHLSQSDSCGFSGRHHGLNLRTPFSQVSLFPSGTEQKDESQIEWFWVLEAAPTSPKHKLTRFMFLMFIITFIFDGFYIVG